MVFGGDGGATIRKKAEQDWVLRRIDACTSLLLITGEIIGYSCEKPLMTRCVSTFGLKCPLA
jgi:hypothetical protein